MTYEEFTQLYAQLCRVLDLIDTAPDRHETTTKGLLADADWTQLLNARSTLHRLGLWVNYPNGSPESYLPEPVAALNPEHKNDGFVRS